MRVTGHLVADIQRCESLAEAVSRHGEEAMASNLSTKWIEAVFRSRRSLPVLDTSFDVRGTGVDILQSMGAPAETQSEMWRRWAFLPDDAKASWVQDFKKLDFSQPEDVTTYTRLLIGLLSERET